MLFLWQQKTLDGALPKKPPKMVWSEDDPFPLGANMWHGISSGTMKGNWGLHR